MSRTLLIVFFNNIVQNQEHFLFFYNLLNFFRLDDMMLRSKTESKKCRLYIMKKEVRIHITGIQRNEEAEELVESAAFGDFDTIAGNII